MTGKAKRPSPPNTPPHQQKRPSPRHRLGKHFIVEYADEDDGEYELEELEATFAYALDALEKSPTFVQMMRETGRKPYTVVFDDTIEEYGSISPEDRVIYLTSHAPAAQLVSTLAHEIRHAHQYANALGTDTADRLKKRDFIVWNLLIEADAASTEAQVLAEIGHTTLGAEAKAHSAAMPIYRTVHKAFNRLAEKDPTSVTDGRAQLAAFKRYFRTKLVDIYKAGFGEYYKELRKDGIKADRHIPDTAAKALGWHQQAGNYLDQDRVLTNRTGQSLRRNAAFSGDEKRKKGRNSRFQVPALDPRRVSLQERCEALLMPAFARPQQPSGVTGRPLRPF